MTKLIAALLLLCCAAGCDMERHPNLVWRTESVWVVDEHHTFLPDHGHWENHTVRVR